MVRFTDSYDTECDMSASSVIFDYEDSFERPGTSAIWLGIEKATPRILASDAPKLGLETSQATGWIDYPLPEKVFVGCQMHLNREQVAGLIDRLQTWLDTGSF